MRRMLLFAIASAVMASCSIPMKRDDVSLFKMVPGESEITAIFDRYRNTHEIATKLLDPKPLSTVESGPVLAIDSGSFEVAAAQAEATENASDGLELLSSERPRFVEYPLWFMAVARSENDGAVRVQIFSRQTATDPWFLTANPGILPETNLPALRHRKDGSAVAVDSSDSSGSTISPDRAARAYAKALSSAGASGSDIVATDDFIRQMRAIATQNRKLSGVKFDQSWSVDNTDYALQTRDGGILAWVTLARRDTYKVRSGKSVRWPSGSPQRTFFADGITRSGRLDYLHQVLLFLPAGQGQPRALGHHGGVIAGESAPSPGYSAALGASR